MLITKEQYFSFFPNHKDITKEIEANAEELLKKVNSLIAEFPGAATSYQLSSGFRPVEHELKQGRSGKSKHTKGLALDIIDNDRKLGMWCRTNKDKLKSRNLAMEHLDDTIGKNTKWLHLQIGLPPSGNVEFKP